MDHRYGKVQWGPSGTRVMTSDTNWAKPLAWNRAAESLGVRHRVFCASLADIFEDWNGPMMSPGEKSVVLGKLWKPAFDVADRMTMQDVRLQLFDLIDRTPHLDWLLLTKRPENIVRFWPDRTRRENVWLGTSVENQEFAQKRIPALLNCRELASVLFLSCEPVVAPIDLTSIWVGRYEYYDCLNGIHVGHSFQQSCPTVDWVIAGGESGPEARPADKRWFRELRSQCEFAKVPFHFKQWGEFDENQVRVGKRNAGRLLDGETHDGLPLVSVV
jgi:protein gp37